MGTFLRALQCESATWAGTVSNCNVDNGRHDDDGNDVGDDVDNGGGAASAGADADHADDDDVVHESSVMNVWNDSDRRARPTGASGPHGIF